MSTKHNVSHKTKFGRGVSHYPDRLAARGLSKAPSLAAIEGATGLRLRQDRRVMATCTEDHEHNVIDCNGHAWRVFAEDAPRVVMQDAPPDQPEASLRVLTAKLAKHYAQAA